MRLKSTSKPTYKSTFAAVIANPWFIAIGLCAIPAVAAYAQATILPASPAAPQVVQQAMPQQSGLINLDFRDVPVVQLITMIAQQGNVGILISPDVDSKLVIPYISLKDETPQDAIKKAALVAGLKWQKLDDKTYMVGKSLSNIGDQSSQNPTSGSLPVLPFGQSQNSAPSTSSLPDIANNVLQSEGNVYTPMPKLYQDGGDATTVDKDKTSYTYIKVHNVRPDILAYWIDPAHHPKPPEYVAADRGLAHAINPYPAQPAVDPNITAQIQGNVSGAANPYSMYNPYANPYANPYQPNIPQGFNAYSPYNMPYMQGAAQFGNNNRGGGNNRSGGFGGGSGNNSNSEGVLEAPKGIGTIISIDAQNALLVYGTADGVAQLRQIIDFLDRPIRQVEIEAQFVDVGTTDAKAFGLSISSNNSNSTNTNSISSNLGTVPSGEGGTSLTARFGSFQATLKALVTNKKARIVNSPRVTTLNNLTATLFSATSTPIVLSSSTSGIGGQVGSQQNAFFLTTSIGLVVTPTINNDDTITVFLTPQVQVQTPVQTTSTGGSSNNNSSNQNTASSIPSFTSQYLTTVATVKDGDTIVLGGLRTKNVSYTENDIPILSKLPIIGGLFKSKQKNDDDRELVIFLTARILHRTDDLAPLPGT
jgi:type II secretory pathway component GspD/PulD (secretin)